MAAGTRGFALMMALGCPHTAAVDVPDFGFEWATIRSVGNRPTAPNEVVMRAAVLDEEFVEIGAVDYLYRIAITEVSVTQWLEFVAAYRPFYAELNGVDFVVDSSFTGPCISAFFPTPTVRGICSPLQPTEVTWEYAARYCNWLHNGKANEAWAFETGAYDTSTFVVNADGQGEHQVARSPGARFWIPSLDEWVKAAYFDPDRYGSGRPGYWAYPDGSNSRPIAGLSPASGGERNAGSSSFFPTATGTFTEVRSPWGLLDCAGGVREHLEDVAPESEPLWGTRLRLNNGTHHSEVDQLNLPNGDRLDFWASQPADRLFIEGLRIASVAPCPADLAAPTGVLDVADAMAFAIGFQNLDPSTDIADPGGIFDLRDIQQFVLLLTTDCAGQGTGP